MKIVHYCKVWLSQIKEIIALNSVTTKAFNNQAIAKKEFD
jgi:hypothetical protein